MNRASDLSIISGEQIRQWADKRADDAGRLARQLISERSDRLASLSPRVKPLEWEDAIHGGWVALGDAGLYHVHVGFNDEKPFWFFASPFDHEPNEFSSPEDAKAAAQSDYERRIMSAIDLSASPHPTSADKLEVVERQYRGKMHGGKWSPWQRITIEPNPIYQQIEFRALVDAEVATRFITEQAERIAELERERDSWRAACMEAREGCNQRSNTIRSLRRHLEAAEADSDRMKEALAEIMSRHASNILFHDEGLACRARAALNGGAEK